MNIRELLNKISDITSNIFKQEYNIYDEVKNIIPDMQRIYKEFIELIPALNNIGMEIDINVPIMQLKNLLEALESRDKVMMFDTLNYEIKDTLSLYDEIREIME